MLTELLTASICMCASFPEGCTWHFDLYKTRATTDEKELAALYFPEPNPELRRNPPLTIDASLKQSTYRRSSFSETTLYLHIVTSYIPDCETWNDQS